MPKSRRPINKTAIYSYVARTTHAKIPAIAGPSEVKTDAIDSSPVCREPSSAYAKTCTCGSAYCWTPRRKLTDETCVEFSAMTSLWLTVFASRLRTTCELR